jgi:hypothetical protein
MRLVIALVFLLVAACATPCQTNGNCKPGDICVKSKCCDLKGHVR